MLAKPYPFPFQNTLEQLLILASVLVVVLGLVYTFILKSSLVIEAILLAVLLGSLVGGVAYLIVKHRQGHATVPVQARALDARNKGNNATRAAPAQPPPPAPPPRASARESEMGAARQSSMSLRSKRRSERVDQGAAGTSRPENSHERRQQTLVSAQV